MSHHTVCAKSYITKNGLDVYVNLGWDKPANGFYMYVECDNEEFSDEEGLLYGNLSDIGTTRDLNYFIRKLIDLKIAVPTEMFLAAIKDMRHRVVNESRDWPCAEMVTFGSYQKYYQNIIDQVDRELPAW